jgi:hypothetical protein
MFTTVRAYAMRPKDFLNTKIVPKVQIPSKKILKKSMNER